MYRKLFALYAIDDSIAASSIFAMAFPFAFQQFAKIRVGSYSIDRFRHLLTQFAIGTD